MKTKLASAFVWLLSAALLVAGTVTLQWDPNPPSDQVTGYLVYQSDGGQPYQLVGGTATNTTITLPNIPWASGVVYSWYVIATNAAGLRSDPSATVSAVRPGNSKNIKILSAVAP